MVSFGARACACPHRDEQLEGDAEGMVQDTKGAPQADYSLSRGCPWEGALADLDDHLAGCHHIG